MSAPDFRTALAAAGLSQAGYRRLIERLAGEAMDPGTISRRARRKTKAPTEVMALLEILRTNPKLLKELER